MNANILKSIYYALYESHINYVASYGDKKSLQWTIYTFSRKRQKALRIIDFKQCNGHSSPLFHHSKIIKIADKVKIENCLFIKKYTNIKLPSIFTNCLHFHQCLKIIKDHLRLKEIFKYLCLNNNIWKKCFYLYGCKNLEWYSERNERWDVKHIFISWTKIITHRVLLEYV